MASAEENSPTRTGGGASTRSAGMGSTVWKGVKEAGITVILSLVFLLVYILVFTLERQIFARDIIFYDALLCLGLTTATLVMLWLAGAFARLSGAAGAGRIPLAIVLFLSLGYAFAITVPALIDRSISFFMITQVVESGDEGVTREDLEERFIQQYVLDYGAIPRRLQEQLRTGNFEPRGDRYIATDRGVLTYRIHHGFLTMFRASEDFLSSGPAR